MDPQIRAKLMIANTNLTFSPPIKGDMGRGQKLVIKKFKPLPTGSQPQFPALWVDLEYGIAQIFSNNPNLDLQALYKKIELACKLGYGYNIQPKLELIIIQHVSKHLQGLQAKFGDGLELVLNVQKLWREFLKHMEKIKAIFSYWDRTCALINHGITNSWDLGLTTFQNHVIGSSKVQKVTQEVLLQLIDQERRGDKSSDPTIILSLMQMVHDLSLYLVNFQTLILDQASEFYYHEAATLLPTLNFSAHLDHIQNRITLERQRGFNYLPRDTRPLLLKIVYDSLMVDCIDDLLNKGFEKSLIDKDMKELSKVYRLFLDADRDDLFCKRFTDTVTKLGTSLIQDVNNDKHMIESILTLRSTLTHIVKEPFMNPVHYQRALIRSFEQFMSTRGSAPAKLLAKALDSVLRSGNLKLSEGELDDKLDQLFGLFRFVQGKDIFEAFYKQSLAKRLLLNRSASYDTERMMISKLKGQLGAEYTDKLDGMFKDIQLSEELTKYFKQSHQGPTIKFDLDVNILTQAYWPTYSPVPIKLPNHLEDVLHQFQLFYLGQHAGRKLFWQHSLSKAVVIGYFNGKRKELTVSLYQMVILLMFNPTNQNVDPRFSMKQIREVTGLDSESVKLSLASLALPKMPILIKTPDTKTYVDTDTYHFNNDLNTPMSRIKVNTLQLKETLRGDNKIQNQVLHNRQFLIDALVVRLMKTKRKMSYVDLLKDTLHKLQFPATPHDVKSRVENLLEREFLERDETDIEILRYVA